MQTHHPVAKSAVLALALLLGSLPLAARVVINEIAWAGTAASPSDEWIELYNRSDQPVDLAGWILTFGDATIHFDRAEDATVEFRRTTIEPGGFYLLERTDDTTVSDLEADLIFKGVLRNDGMDLRLIAPDGTIVDRVDAAESGWPAGTAAGGLPPYATMERADPDGTPAWRTNDGHHRSGLDADGQPLNGTPRAVNSATLVARHAPTVTWLGDPVSSDPVSGVVVVSWTAVDPDGDPNALRISLHLAGDDGAWVPIAENLANSGRYPWNTAVHPDGDYRLRIVATDPDGYTGSVESETFAIANAADVP